MAEAALAMLSAGTEQTVYRWDCQDPQLAKCVLRRPNRFDELNGEKMSDTLRQRLRENVEKEREARNTELHGGSSVTQRLKGSLFRRK